MLLELQTTDQNKKRIANQVNHQVNGHIYWQFLFQETSMGMKKKRRKKERRKD